MTLLITTLLLTTHAMRLPSLKTFQKKPSSPMASPNGGSTAAVCCSVSCQDISADKCADSRGTCTSTNCLAKDGCLHICQDWMTACATCVAKDKGQDGTESSPLKLDKTDPVCKKDSAKTEPPKVCCKAMNPECMGCQDGISAEEWCKKHPGKLGCTSKEPCCNERRAECKACGDGMSVSEWCKKHPGVYDCESSEGETKQQEKCCKATTAECLACQNGVSPYEYCKKYPTTIGCKP